MFVRIMQVVVLVVMLVSLVLVQFQIGIIFGMVLELLMFDLIGNVVVVVDEIVYVNVFVGLICIGFDGQVLFGLVESWQVQDGGKVYLFQLCLNVIFYDGSSFDVQDVVFFLDCVWVVDSMNV